MSARLPAVLAALTFAAVAGGAFAEVPVTLNTDLSDPAGKVTLGELFDNAGPARDVVVAERVGPTVVLDADQVRAFAHRYGLDWDNPKGLRRIIVRAGASASAASRNIEVLTYARDLAAGEVVQPQDLLWAKAAAAPFDAPRDADAAIGLAARRPLRQGDAVSAHDLAAPLVVKAGDTISVVYADGGVTLTLEARALGAAAVGDTVNVLNPASKKQIVAVASGPGEAVVGPEAARLKAERDPAQLALR